MVSFEKEKLSSFDALGVKFNPPYPRPTPSNDTALNIRAELMSSIYSVTWRTRTRGKPFRVPWTPTIRMEICVGWPHRFSGCQICTIQCIRSQKPTSEMQTLVMNADRNCSTQKLLLWLIVFKDGSEQTFWKCMHQRAEKKTLKYICMCW